MTTIGLVSTYQEGPLALSAVGSLLPACDSILVAEGPIGAPVASGTATDWRSLHKSPRVTVLHGEWASDAAKRTHLLERAKQRRAEWAFVLDADEVLLWGEYLRDQLAYLEARERETGEIALGSSIRLVEVDGSVVAAGARILRLAHVERILHSAYHMLLTNGVEVSRPNIPLLAAGEPDQPPTGAELSLQRRRPVQGEPHILHRSLLRDPARPAVRQHEAEADGLRAMVARLGATGETPAPGGVPIYLPDHLTERR